MNFNLYSFFSNRQSNSELQPNEESAKNLISEISFNQFNLIQIKRFLQLIEEDSVISQFLEFDHCYTLADKYLLSIVFVYFIRANLSLSEYNRANFFLALYLAHDIEEDDESFKEHVMIWALGRKRAGQNRQFLKERDQFWMRIDYRAFVSIQCCLEVMNSTPYSPLWQRERDLDHICYYETDDKCPNCKVEEEAFYHTDLESENTEDTCYDTDSSEEYSPPPIKRLRTEE